MLVGLFFLSSDSLSHSNQLTLEVIQILLLVLLTYFKSLDIEVERLVGDRKRPVGEPVDGRSFLTRVITLIANKRTRDVGLTYIILRLFRSYLVRIWLGPVLLEWVHC